MKLKNSLTTSLVVIILGFFIIANYAPKVTWGSLGLVDHLLLINKAVFSDNRLHGVFAGEWWRIFTVILTHQNWQHVGFNMIAFFQLGNITERFYGRSRYVILLIVSTVASSLLFLLLVPANQASVGASGMIFGVFGAMVVSGKRMGIDYPQLMVWVVINLVITFTSSNIAWQAHVGGFVAGVVLAYAFKAVPRRRTFQAWE